MATRNPFLTNWVKDAYSMELGLATALENQAREVQNDSTLQKGLSRHLEQTRHHADLLRDCLQRMGENPGGIQAANPFAGRFGQAGGDRTDANLRTELIDYVTENFEIASYQALAALARQSGDDDTARVCDQILQDEVTMVRALDQLVPGLRAHDGQVGGNVQRNIQVAHANFDALNAKDLNRWRQMLTGDFRQEAPGTMGALDGQQSLDYLQNFFSAFPDLHFDPLRTIAQEAYVVVNWMASGTHTGPLHGPNGQTIPPTHRRATEYGTTTFECQDDKIRRAWVYFDMFALLEQLGLMSGR